jgi:O-antigen/teichoic acid export membrane protein
MALITTYMQGRLAYARTVLRVKPFDTSSSAGRSQERIRRALWTAIALSLAKAINTLTLLAIVPLVLGYLGSERFGLWMTLTAAVAFLGVADLGVGNSVLNLVSESNGRDDSAAIRKCVTNAFLLLAGIAGVTAILFVVVFNLVNWAEVFGASTSLARQETGPSVAVLVGCFLVNLPLSIVPRIQMGLQEGYRNSVWQAVSNLSVLAALAVLVCIQVGLAWLVLAIAAGPIIENGLTALDLLVVRRRWLLPSLRLADASLALRIMQLGIMFVFLQLANVTTYYADNLIIARVLGPEAVTDFAVPARLFALVPAILYMFLSPLWPAYAEASTRGDYAWVKATLGRSIITTVCLCTISALVLVASGELLLRIWTGSKVPYSFSLMIAMGVSTTILALVTAIALYLNAINKMRLQVILALMAAVVASVLKVTFVNLIGLPGIAWGNALAIFCLMLIPYSIYVALRLSRQPSEFVGAH